MSAVEDDLGLSMQAMSIWGKTNRVDETMWLPLYVHMSDSAAVASHLWDEWVPQGTKDVLSRDFDGDFDLSRKVLLFLAGIHDIGKATPVFQCTPITHSSGMEDASLSWKPRNAGLPFPPTVIVNTREPTHPIAGQLILQSYLQKERHWDKSMARSYACIVGGHHGQPPTSQALNNQSYTERIGWAGSFGGKWIGVQCDLVEFVIRQVGLSDDDFNRLSGYRMDVYAETVMTGLVIMADWIASNSDDDLFPLIPLNPLEMNEALRSQMATVRDWQGLCRRQDRGWKELDLSPKWQPSHDKVGINELFASRFHLPTGASPRPVQVEAVRLAQSVADPGIMVIEAPMGEGKTEAALAAAEILAERTGRGGVCVALPTMATTDAMFGRFKDWVDALPQDDERNEKSLSLRHGKASLNKQFNLLKQASRQLKTSSVFDDDQKTQIGTYKSSANQVPLGLQGTPEAVVSDWLTGRKKGVLVNFLVCTIDQVLMAALQMKHVALRQLALVNKVVIIDECHAYDAYMREYLKRTLEWLGGFHTPVILLSATLPEEIRSQLVDAYRSGYQSTEQAALSAEKEREVGLQQGINGEEDLLAAVWQLETQYRKNDDLSRAAAQSDGEPKDTGQASEVDCLDDLNQYPLITYTSGPAVESSQIDPSGRRIDVDCHLLGDGDDDLVDLLKVRLADGGCAGIVCNTVGRAQHAADILSEAFGDDMVKLTHSRFIDQDRMDNEVALRGMLGPEATVGNGCRPGRLIVIGTQVLEQSLDVDFDLMVSDIAPVDLLLQRMGRLHRHHRGNEESDRPPRLRRACCFVRGIDSWNEACPVFAKNIDSIYPAASLLETLSVLTLTGASLSCLVHLPTDIAPLVRTAYDAARVEGLIPDQWFDAYRSYVAKRHTASEDEINKAHGYLMHDSAELIKEQSTTIDLCNRTLKSHDEEKARQAVRDTMDSVEVLLLRGGPEGYRLLPWIGGDGVEYGAPVFADEVPNTGLAQRILRCAVRLPISMCLPTQIDDLIKELEEQAVDFVEAWHESSWLEGCLPMILSDEPVGGTKHISNQADIEDGSDFVEEGVVRAGAVFTCRVNGFDVRYSRARGLEVANVSKDEGGPGK